jgi:hypothetical protein
MENNTPNTIPLSEITTTIKNFIFYIFSQYKIVLLFLMIALSVGFAYNKMQPNRYKATATFILESKSGGGGLSGLASQFGFDIGSLTGGGGGLFDGDNIFDIMTSKNLIEKVLLSKVSDTNNETLADLYLKIHNKQGALNQLKLTNYSQDSILSSISDKIIEEDLLIEKPNKKTTVIRVTCLSASTVFSKLFTERLLDETSKMYIDIKTGNLTRNINKIQKVADSLENSLNTIYVRNYINQTRPNESVYRDKTVTYALYSEVVKNLETLKLSLINQTPVLQTIDLPRYPLVNTKKGMLITLIYAFSVGVILSLIVIMYKYSAKIN